MSNLYFDIPEFVVLDGEQANIPLTPTIADKIMRYHLLPCNDIRQAIGEPVYVRSGYRPVWWEKSKGRDGTSQHCYRTKGATDISIEKHSAIKKPAEMWLGFFRALKESPYRRIAYYPDLDFFHCDYKTEDRKYYIARPGWEVSDYRSLAELIKNNHNGN